MGVPTSDIMIGFHSPFKRQFQVKLFKL